MSEEAAEPIVDVVDAGGDFELVHEHLELEVLLDERTVRGAAELTFVPLVDTAEALYINARQIAISSITVDGVPVQYEMLDFVSRPTGEESAFDLESYTTAYNAALAESDCGELVISRRHAALEWRQ